MRFLPLAAVLSAVLLAGCTDADWDQVMTYTGVGDQQVAQAAPAQPVRATVQAAPDTSFCEAVAKQDATGDGFDPATRQRVFQRSLQQCLALFGTGGEAPRGTRTAESQ